MTKLPLSNAPLVAIALTLLATGCERGAGREPASEKPPKSAPHVDEVEHEELPTRVQLPADVLTAAHVRSELVANEALPVTVELSGEVTPDPNRTADVTVAVPGRIASVSVKDGDRVQKRQLIAVFESAELARARAGLLSAESKASAARANADRLSRLADKGLAAGQEAKQAEAEATADEAEVAAARQSLAAFGMEVSRTGGARLELRAPIGGFVVSRDAFVGQSVEPNHRIARIVDFERAWFLARVFEKDLSRVTEGAQAEVRLNAWPDEPIVGTVESVGRALDPTARTVVARVVLQGAPGRLRAGLFGKARISTPTTDGGMARPVVPLTAVTRIAGQDVVFVRHPDGDFEVHPVKLGPSAGGRVSVLTGLRTGEDVVVDGVYALKSAVLKGTFGEEE